ncbi:MAG: NAD-dependent epimerase/dehydratase family protein [Planctomycetota bacterium]
MIFVTGGTGLLGNCIVRALVEQGEEVRVLCRKGTSKEAFDDLQVEIIEGDLSSPELLAEAASGCRAVIHSAAFIHIGWQKLQQSREVNVVGTENIIEASKQSGARLVHVSTVDTLPAAVDLSSPIDEKGDGGISKTPCSYVVSKSEAEEVVRQAIKADQMDAVIIHPGFMLAPFDWKPSSGRMMLEVNKSPIVAAPPGGCSVCDARDVASAIARSVELGRSGQNYILAGANLSYQEFWRQILQTTGRNRRVWRLGKGVRLVGACIDLANRILPIKEGDVNGGAIAMGSLNHFYDSSLAEAELEYKRRPLEETLGDAWEWLSTRF